MTSAGEGLVVVRYVDAERKSLMKKNRFPKGWNQEKVQEVVAHYERQTEEALAEDEALFSDPNKTVIEVPRELLPVIREMIAKHQSNSK